MTNHPANPGERSSRVFFVLIYEGDEPSSSLPIPHAFKWHESRCYVSCKYIIYIYNTYVCHERLAISVSIDGGSISKFAISPRQIYATERSETSNEVMVIAKVLAALHHRRDDEEQTELVYYFVIQSMFGREASIAVREYALSGGGRNITSGK